MDIIPSRFTSLALPSRRPQNTAIECLAGRLLDCVHHQSGTRPASTVPAAETHSLLRVVVGADRTYFATDRIHVLVDCLRETASFSDSLGDIVVFPSEGFRGLVLEADVPHDLGGQIPNRCENPAGDDVAL